MPESDRILCMDELYGVKAGHYKWEAVDLYSRGKFLEDTVPLEYQVIAFCQREPLHTGPHHSETAFPEGKPISWQ